jgi:hypothetical protein
MQNIPIMLAEPGMILGRDVCRDDNPNSPPICGKGIELTESLLERLKNMGIQSLTVEGHPVWQEGDKSLEELLAELDARFRMVESDPIMMKLKELHRTLICKSMGADHD